MLETRGGASYEAAFTLLEKQMRDDLAALRDPSRDTEAYRPVVFFVSDGTPTDGSAWKTPYSDLVTQKWYPLFIPIGVQGAQLDVLRELPWPRSYVSGMNMACYAASHRAGPATIATIIIPWLIENLDLVVSIAIAPKIEEAVYVVPRDSDVF